MGDERMYGYADDANYYRPMMRNFRNAADRKRTAWLGADESRQNLMLEIAVLAQKSDFFNSLHRAFNEYGTLSEKQEAVARKSISESAARKAEFQMKHAEANAGSNYVGDVGQRMDFTLTVVFTKELIGYYLNSLIDADGNNFMYFGGCLAEKGSTVTVRATIKRHQDYNGVKQTVISRPKVISVEG